MINLIKRKREGGQDMSMQEEKLQELSKQLQEEKNIVQELSNQVQKLENLYHADKKMIKGVGGG